MFEPIRGGTRGGQAEFKWTDVSADKDRENYLGHSINAPTGRWQKNKDVHWYNRDARDTEAERVEEIRKIKEAEAEALAAALGFAPAAKPSVEAAAAGPVVKDIAIANIDDDDPQHTPADADAQKALDKEDRRTRRAERREEKRARKERRRLRASTRGEAEVYSRGEAYEGDEAKTKIEQRDAGRSPGRRYSRSPARGSDARDRRARPRSRSVSPPRRRSASPARKEKNVYDGPGRESGRERDRDRDKRRWEVEERREAGAARWGRR